MSLDSLPELEVELRVLVLLVGLLFGSSHSYEDFVSSLLLTALVDLFRVVIAIQGGVEVRLDLVVQLLDLLLTIRCELI